jgi:hypothetical protein
MTRVWVKRSVLTATAFGTGAFTLCSPAFGFFPPVVNTDGKVSVSKPPLVTPSPPVVIPPIDPPPKTPPVTPPVPPPCCCDPGPTPKPQGAPEPATLVVAGTGLAALAAARLRKRSR